MNSNTQKTKVLIVGAGVAGSSLAIRLAEQGLRVIVVEKDNFPRHKLCGEFVSPECLSHFEELGVLDSIRDIGGDSIYETRFFAENGKQVSVPSNWFFDGEQGALGISRSEMDARLLNRAKALGTTVYEGSRVVALETLEDMAESVTFRNAEGDRRTINADLVIDATGRSRILGKLAEKGQDNLARKKKIQQIAFKVHYENVRLDKGVCEIYFFRGGYGGLNHVEDGLVNHCFLIDSKVAREFDGDADRIMEEVVLKNERASNALEHSRKTFDWIAVPIEKFGRQRPTNIKNLISIGDARAFIDPFTGSGMLMALESSEMLAAAVSLSSIHSPEMIKDSFEKVHRRATKKRLNFCTLIRFFSSSPKLTSLAISSGGFSSSLLKRIASLTRPAKSH